MPRVSHLLIIILLLSFLDHGICSSKVNCSHLQSKVPRPQLKYMLSGELHVIWQEDKTAGYNFTAYVCCTKLRSHAMIVCVSTCPQFQAMTSCNRRAAAVPNTQCGMKVSHYSEYTVHLRGQYQGCQLKGEKVKIRPSLSIAYPGPVPKFDVHNMQRFGLLIEWTKSFQYVQLMYSLRCKQTTLNNRQKVITSNNLRKPYFCCIRVRLPSYGITPYYSQVCKTSQNKAVNTSRFQCGYTHECRKAVVDNLRDFAGQLTPDDSNWPNVPPAMVLQVQNSSF